MPERAGFWDTQGWGARTPTTGVRIADRSELNLWLQYRPTSGPLQGFCLKTQYSDLLRRPRSGCRRLIQINVSPEF